jgi:hypothetical protein
MCINGKMIYVETFQELGKEGIRKIDGKSELKYDIFGIL